MDCGHKKDFVKTCAKCIGDGCEKLVQTKLWQYGYRVKDVSAGRLYDLLVDDSIRVEVKGTSKLISGMYDRYSWKLSRPVHADFDVLAVVLPQPFGKPIIAFFKSSDVRSKKEINSILIIKSKELNQSITSPLNFFGQPLRYRKGQNND